MKTLPLAELQDSGLLIVKSQTQWNRSSCLSCYRFVTRRMMVYWRKSAPIRSLIEMLLASSLSLRYDTL